MSTTDQNKQVIQRFVKAVWSDRNLAALNDFWSEDCVNHAMQGAENRGLVALRAYHDSFFGDFITAFPDLKIEIVQQLAEGDRVTSYLISQGTHSGSFYGVSPTGKQILTSVIRIDRIQDGKITEHWSVSDAGSLMQQIQ
jgi:steroid delta-isomerase-like uncharacterized protein